MRDAGVPIVPGHRRRHLDRRGPRARPTSSAIPILLKAAAGGGGKGMRLVEAADELEDAFGAAAAEARRAFGDPTLYVEKVLAPARHVEIQVLCDMDGNVLTLGERECSIQRRHQKLIEETPSPALTPELREEMEDAAERACRAVGYVNAGTLEFLLGPDGSFSFIELNARLQVEHPVTELCTGIDLVRAQLHIAAGEPLEVTGRAPRRGHAIEIRLNAEDPARDFMPAPGLVSRFRPALGPGVRIDTFVEDGTDVSPYYDSLLAKLIVWDATARRRSPAPSARSRRRVIEGVPDDARVRARDPAERRVPQRRLLDVDARGARSGRRMSVVVETDAGRSRFPTRCWSGSPCGRRGRRRRPRAAPADDRRGGGGRAALACRPSRRAARRGRASGRRRPSPRRSAMRARSRSRRRLAIEEWRRMISRRQARRQALFLLYQWDLSGAEIGSQYAGEIDPWARELAEEAAAHGGRARRADHGRLGGLDGRPARRRRAERAARRDPRARPGRGAARGRDQRGGRFAKRYASEEAARLVNGILGRIQREGAAERMSAEESLGRAEELLGAARGGPRAARDDRGSRPGDRGRCRSSPSSRRQVEAELQRARDGCRGGCRGRLTSCASSSRRISRARAPPGARLARRADAARAAAASASGRCSAWRRARRPAATLERAAAGRGRGRARPLVLARPRRPAGARRRRRAPRPAERLGGVRRGDRDPRRRRARSRRPSGSRSPTRPGRRARARRRDARDDRRPAARPRGRRTTSPSCTG